VNALFVLLPRAGAVDDMLATVAPEHVAAARAVPLRTYPRADDARHLHSLVRSGRDPLATQWHRGLLLAIGGGAGLGALVNGVLTACGMLGGLYAIGIPLGLCLGAFLGGFTAMMTGTEAPRHELHPLLLQARAGDTLLQWSAADRRPLQALAAAAEARGYPFAFVP
jgi:hypothetical protein